MPKYRYAALLLMLCWVTTSHIWQSTLGLLHRAGFCYSYTAVQFLELGDHRGWRPLVESRLIEEPSRIQAGGGRGSGYAESMIIDK